MTTDPFTTIESAQEFIELLCRTIVETKNEIDADIERQRNTPSRRLDALRIASVRLDMLDKAMKRSNRALNDLRSLRRLLFQERTAGAESTIAAD